MKKTLLLLSLCLCVQSLFAMGNPSAPSATMITLSQQDADRFYAWQEEQQQCSLREEAQRQRELNQGPPRTFSISSSVPKQVYGAACARPVAAPRPHYNSQERSLSDPSLSQSEAFNLNEASPDYSLAQLPPTIEDPAIRMGRECLARLEEKLARLRIKFGSTFTQGSHDLALLSAAAATYTSDQPIKKGFFGALEKMVTSKKQRRQTQVTEHLHEYSSVMQESRKQLGKTILIEMLEAEAGIEKAEKSLDKASLVWNSKYQGLKERTASRTRISESPQESPEMIRARTQSIHIPRSHQSNLHPQLSASY